jgi:hypothetical protein
VYAIAVVAAAASVIWGHLHYTMCVILSLIVPPLFWYAVERSKVPESISKRMLEVVGKGLQYDSTKVLLAFMFTLLFIIYLLCMWGFGRSLPF